MMDLWNFYVQRPVRAMDAPPQVPGGRQTQVIGWLDSLDTMPCVVGQYLVQPDGRLQYVDDD